MTQMLTRHMGRRIAFALLTVFSAPVFFAHSAAAVSSPAEPEDRLAYVLFSAGSSSTSMSGSTDDMRRAQALRTGKEGLLHVRQGGAAYLIRDAATLRRAEAIFEPQRVLGAKQGELGSRQAALGGRQAQLGVEQARLGRLQADARPSRAGELGRQQHELGRRQNALGQEQAVLGRQQNALGQEQSRLARAPDESLRALIADAIRRGAAQRVN